MKPERVPLKVLDLFSGIGGFSLGLERTGGFKTIAFCEIDNYCQRVLRKHWPNVFIHSDIRKLGRANFEGWEFPDVITGGFPCQDVSQANTYAAAGLDGARSGLWTEMRRLIRELRPRFVIVENVPALAYRGLNRVLGDLAESGYDAEWDCIPAAALGAPHIRDRIWILAYPASVGLELCVQGGNECVGAVEQGNNRGEAERGKDWELIALVPGVCHGTASDWWQSQSRMVRSANGVPDWMERVRGLGNSIVPQIAEWIGTRILEAERQQ